MNKDQFWHWHRNQLRYHHMEANDTQNVEITDTTRTSPITGDSPPVFLHHEESTEDAETTASDSTSATGESSSRTSCYPLRDC